VSHVPGWRLRVEHTTTFDYSSPARASFNEVRQVPVTTTRQTVLEWKVTTAPAAPQYSYRDYWGTHVVAFDVGAPHHQLTVHAVSLIDTRLPGAAADGTWAQVEAERDRHVELLEPSRYVGVDTEIGAVARKLRRSSPAQTVDAVADWVHESLEYVPGATDARTSAAQAFAARRGVCQDFAHLALAALRSVGIAARYVSGYLHPDAEATLGTTVTGESHAWVEAWTGSWRGIDPTNHIGIGLRHVVVARGRDYADVAPVRGIYAGSAEHETSVAVAVTRTA
jgi:transglutaminase-like putative cysteine protease